MKPVQRLPSNAGIEGDIARQLAILLGPALSPGDGTRIAADLLALASSLSQARTTLQNALAECFPDTAVETLDQWEQMMGLAVREDLSTSDRQKRLLSKFRAAFSGTPQDITTAVSTIATVLGVQENSAAGVASSNPRAVFLFAVLIAGGDFINDDTNHQARLLIDQMKPAHTKASLGASAGFFCDLSKIEFDLLGS